MLSVNAKEFHFQNKSPIIFDSSDSESESICDELNIKNNIIQKQIEDDLLTHDFSKQHVTREQIQDILGMKIKNVSYYQR